MNYFRVVATALNVRNQPSLEGEVIGLLRRGDTVKALAYSADGYWVNIQTHGGNVGWASHKFLAPIPQPDDQDFPWLSIALGELLNGVREIPGPKNHPRIVEYLRSTTLSPEYADSDETPWCSAFVNWCVERSGYEGTDSAWARSWLRWGQPTAIGRRGCIVVFTRGEGGHVGFYVDETPTHIEVLGGNQSNAVTIAEYPKESWLGFRTLDPAAYLV